MTFTKNTLRFEIIYVMFMSFEQTIDESWHYQHEARAKYGFRWMGGKIERHPTPTPPHFVKEGLSHRLKLSWLSKIEGLDMSSPYNTWILFS